MQQSNLTFFPIFIGLACFSILQWGANHCQAYIFDVHTVGAYIPQPLIHLCALQYLIPSSFPGGTSISFGLDSGGTIEFDLSLRPSVYQNNLPQFSPKKWDLLNNNTTSLVDSEISIASSSQSNVLSLISTQSNSAPQNSSENTSPFRLFATIASFTNSIFNHIYNTFFHLTLLTVPNIAPSHNSVKPSTNNDNHDDKNTQTNSVECATQICKSQLQSSDSSHLQVDKTQPLLDIQKTVNNTFLVVMNSWQWVEFEKVSTFVDSIVSPKGRIFDSNFRNMIRIPFDQETLKQNITVDHLDRYTALIINGDNLKLLIDGTVTYRTSDGGHLSYELRYIPTVYFTFFLLYLVATFVVLIHAWQIRNLCNSLHWLLLLNLILCTINLLFDNIDIRSIQFFGRTDFFIWIVPRLLRKIQEILLLANFLLIGLGWNIIRDRLSRVEIQICSGFCVISFYMGMFELLLGTFQASRSVLHFLLYFFVFISTNFNISVLKTYMCDSRLTLNTIMFYNKYSALCSYRSIFLIYLLKPVLLATYRILLLKPAYSYLELVFWEEWMIVSFDLGFDLIVAFLITWKFLPARPMRIFKGIISDGRLAEPNNNIGYLSF